MSAERVYRKALGIEEIVVELRAERGAAWDPRIVDLALESIGQPELVA
jgi:HD-GYP domain-containing protein (c-di-GMP phosphodiesterase class II)